MKPVLDPRFGTACVDCGSEECKVELDAIEPLSSCEAGNVLKDPSMHSKDIDLDSDCP